MVKLTIENETPETRKWLDEVEPPFVDLGLELRGDKEYLVGRLWNGKELITDAELAKLSGSLIDYRFQNDMNNMTEEERRIIQRYHAPEQRDFVKINGKWV